ncbi:hypothetical protein ACFCYC_34350 [Streptomyces sp. NPDC056402]|uniref:hypothetical protein n=1 Tax=Streptomyces sp. NPDC056402 TaxID=3345810 RepID=UPI0035DF274B
MQVVIHDEDDDCSGPWMFHDGALVEVPLARTERFHRRFHRPAPPTQEFPPDPGSLWRTDGERLRLPERTPAHLRDPRPAR